MTEQALAERVSELMRKNRRTSGSYMFTVPSPEHYPFQWLWDSCFHAIILSHIDPALAVAEIRSVTAKPLANGLLPHIIYWDERYRTVKWGREYQGDLLSAAWGTDGVSSITQPPILASAVWQLYMRTQDVGFLQEIYPVLRSHYLCLMTERNFSAHGLIGIINPDESGEDNSPRFDIAQGLLPRHTPLENFRKRIARVHEHATCNFDVQNCTRRHFWVEDVSFNAIAVCAYEALSMIAREIGELTDAVTFKLCAEQIRTSMHLHMKFGYRFFSLQGEEQKPALVETWSLFMPLYAGLLHKEEAALLIERVLLDRERFFTEYPIPSVSRSDVSYTDDDLWRGPTWMAVNWFIYKGLKRYGYNDLAGTLKAKSLALIERSGFREFYSTDTGEGHGAHGFTWGGLVLDME